MTLEDLISKGYFLKELPPPFSTELFASKIETIMTTWESVFNANTDISTGLGLTKLAEESKTAFKERVKEKANDFISKYNSSSPATFSLAKGDLARRQLKIPNPKHFSHLAKLIVDNWDEISKIYLLSEFSESHPIIDGKSRAVKTYSKSVNHFREKLAITSYNCFFEVRVDISKFYPTIYTHSITWAFLGKEDAKKYFNLKGSMKTADWKSLTTTDNLSRLYEISNNIDVAVRACQERQSIGIPIGPDTSHIVAELISCRIDSLLKDKFKNKVTGCRYYDDYYLYTSTRDQAEKILKSLQTILNDFQLELNESKVKIKEFPFGFENDWVTRLSQFRFDGNQRHYLKQYFSLAFGFASEDSTKADWILKYSLRPFEWRSVQITKENWDLFESLLLKTALVEPSTLKEVTRILLTYKHLINKTSKRRIQDVLKKIITIHIETNHNYEVSWALWCAVSFEIELTQTIADSILQSNDTISILILFDMREKGLLNGTPDFSILNNFLKNENLSNEYWLLIYETIKKGWLIPPSRTLLNDNHYFKILSDNDVQFYDLNKQLGIIELPKKTNEEMTNFSETTENEYFTNDIPSNFVLNDRE